jgi:hypothetical protein
MLTPQNRWQTTMEYRFVKQRPNYSDLASGRVFCSLPGHPAFPIRLASEIFQRCMAIRQANRVSRPCTLYDPCCGSAYHLSALALLHWDCIREVIGSDIEEDAVALARRNLGLLSIGGLDQRIDEIAEMLRRYGKDSHKEALNSAQALRDRVAALAQERPLKTRAFQANVMDREALVRQLATTTVDVVLTDVPYGQHSHWRGSVPNATSPLWAVLDALLSVLHPTSIVAVISDKQQKIWHERYERVERFQIGKRRVVILASGT